MVRIRDIKMIIILSMKTIRISWSNFSSIITIRRWNFKVKNADLVKKQLDFNFLRRVDEPVNKKKMKKLVIIAIFAMQTSITSN
jgi:hypothetical protein